MPLSPWSFNKILRSSVGEERKRRDITNRRLFRAYFYLILKVFTSSMMLLGVECCHALLFFATFYPIFFRVGRNQTTDTGVRRILIERIIIT